MKISGIYKIESQIKPERIYIGSSINVKERWDYHLCELRKNKHGNSKLQNHYNKYKEQDLIFIILELCFPEFLTAREQYYINKLKPYFNICKIAGSNLGLKRSEETKRKMIISHKGMLGKHHTEESNKKNSERHKGKNHLAETKKKISRAMKGKKSSIETRKKISESRIGKKNPMFGKTYSEESKIKMRMIRIKNSLIRANSKV